MNLEDFIKIMGGLGGLKMQITGKIRRINIKGVRYAFMIGDRWLSIFLNDQVNKETAEIIKNLRENDECEFEVQINKTQTATFYNIIGVLPIRNISEEPPELAEPELAEPELPEKERPDIEKRSEDTIQRSINLSYAVSIINAFIQAGRLSHLDFDSHQTLINFVTTISDGFDDYILGKK